MQVAVDITLPHILKLISQMNLNEIEEVKKTIVKKELYFKKFHKDDLDAVMSDFKKENYSDDFLKDLENGLKKSSVYNVH
jgi:threonyl-tRNA synthetase